jgi:hypothetical protein
VPGARLAASGLLLLQAVLLLGAGIYLAVHAASGGAADRAGALTGAVIVIAVAVLVGFLAMLTHRNVRAARTPTVLLQVLCFPVAYGLLQAGQYGYGIPLIAVPLITLVLLWISAREPEPAENE